MSYTCLLLIATEPDITMTFQNVSREKDGWTFCQNTNKIFAIFKGDHSF